MLAAKSAMFAKSLLSKPAAFQVPSQRVLSTAANLKVDGNQDKQVDSTIQYHVQKKYKIFSVFRFDNERDNKPHYEKYAIDLNEYVLFSCFSYIVVVLWFLMLFSRLRMSKTLLLLLEGFYILKITNILDLVVKVFVVLVL